MCGALFLILKKKRYLSYRIIANSRVLLHHRLGGYRAKQQHRYDSLSAQVAGRGNEAINDMKNDFWQRMARGEK